MNKLRLTTAALVATAVAVVAAGAPAATSTPRAAKQNLVQTAVAAGQFKTLVSLVKQAGLARTLSGKGRFTVFAPTDAAFAKVPKATLKQLAADKAKLRAVLLYHVVGGRLTAANVTKLRSAKTLNGAAVRIRVSGGMVYVNGTRVVKPNVSASNGVIHVINRVLIPAAS
jgi:uncharacterized surface protein with fasciclin (FAS1) repeats